MKIDDYKSVNPWNAFWFFVRASVMFLCSIPAAVYTFAVMQDPGGFNLNRMVLLWCLGLLVVLGWTLTSPNRLIQRISYGLFCVLIAMSLCVLVVIAAIPMAQERPESFPLFALLLITLCLGFLVYSDVWIQRIIHGYFVLMVLAAIATCLTFTPGRENGVEVLLVTVPGIAACLLLFLLINRAPVWVLVFLFIAIPVFVGMQIVFASSFNQRSLSSFLIQGTFGSIYYIFIMIIVLACTLMPRDLNWSQYWVPLKPPPEPED